MDQGTLPADTEDATRRLTAFEVIKQAWHFVNEHEVTTRASAIAFSGMMAAVPFLAMLLTICVQLLPNRNAGRSGGGGGALTVENLELALKSIFPDNAYLVIEDQIANIQAQPPAAVISISVAITLWCASSVFMAIIDAVNRIYGLRETRPYWRLRLRAMGMTIVEMLIVAGALTAIIAWPSIAPRIGLDMADWWVDIGVRWGVAILVVIISFALVFHMGPDVPQRHRWVTPGSIVGTMLFLSTCYCVKLYVQNFAHYDRTYGSLGGVMTLLLWFYISSVVLLLAAEINRICDYTIRRYRQCKAARRAARCKGNDTAAPPSGAGDTPPIANQPQAQPGIREADGRTNGSDNQNQVNLERKSPQDEPPPLAEISAEVMAAYAFVTPIGGILPLVFPPPRQEAADAGSRNNAANQGGQQANRGL